MPQSKIKPINKQFYRLLLGLGLSEIEAKIFGTRYTGEKTKEAVEAFFKLQGHVTDKYKLKNLKEASQLVCKHIKNKNRIIHLTDYDADGVTSASVLYLSFKNILKYDNCDVITNQRYNGNGITDKLLETVLKEHSSKPIDLIITADHGSSDEKSIKILREHNIDVIITDHHLLPETGVPLSANYFVNPQQPECEYNKTISGCGVAYFLIEAVMDVLTEDKTITLSKEDKDYMDFLRSIMSISLIADSMDLSDPNNRYYVKEGLHFLRSKSKGTLYDVLNPTENFINERFLSFNLVPLINAASRMGNSYNAFKFLTSTDEDKEENFKMLTRINVKRKKKQAELMVGVKDQFILDDDNLKVKIALAPKSLGINGVIASMLSNEFKQPSVIFDDNGGDIISGSGRGYHKDFHMRDAYEAIAKRDKDIFIRFGGHAGAAGCSINKIKFKTFKEYFNDELEKQEIDVDNSKINFDYEVKFTEVDFELLKKILNIGPYGQGWAKPVIKTRFPIKSSYCVGKGKEHVIVTLKVKDGHYIRAFYFNGNAGNKWRNSTLGYFYYNMDIETVDGRKMIKLDITDFHE